MTRPRWRKILSDLFGSRIRSLLVVASITVGLFAIGVIATLYVVMSADMREGYRQVNPANVMINAALYDDDLLESLDRIPGVAEVEGARVLTLRAGAVPGQWATIDIKAVPNVSQMEINQVRLVEGAWPSNGREMVVDRYKLDELKAQVGDMITLELFSGRTRQVKLVGVVHDQTIGASGITAGFFLAPAQGYIRADMLEWLEQPRLYNHLYVTGQNENTAALQELADRVRDTFEKNGGEVFSVRVRPSDSHPNLTFIDAIAGVLFVLGLLVVFLSGFLITNTLQALLKQQIQQIGIMKTVGARRRQIVAIYLLLIFVFGLLAFALAVPMAYYVSYPLMDFLALEVNFELQGRRLVPEVIFLQGLIALLMPPFAAILPIWQGARISVHQALSGLSAPGAQSQGPGKFNITGLSRPLIISLRNTFRRKWRLLLTLFTLTLGGAVFIATFNVQVALQQYTDKLSQYYLADVNFNLDRTYYVNRVQSVLANVPGVKRVEGWAAARSEIIREDGSSGESAYLLAPPPESPLVKPILMEGRWIRPGDQNAIALNEYFKIQFPRLQVGDTIRMRVNGSVTEWVVVGIFQMAGKSGGYLAYASYDYLSELVNEPGRAAIYRVEAARPNMTSEEQNQLGALIEERLRQNSMSITDLSTGSSLGKTASDGFNILTGFLLFLAMLTALVGSIGLTGTMSMNVLERTREIGVMRAIGANNRILMTMVIVEGMIIGLLSWLFGSLLAFPITTVLSNSISYSLFDAPTNFGFTPTGFVLWLGVVLVLSVLASVMPARNAARLTIREVLAYE